jgi:ribosomal protein L12E/L44/L45/RPP1/RPP2
MVDYSKWDHIDVDDDDERPRPRVTKLEGPSTLTIGPSGGKQTAAAAAAPAPHQPPQAAKAGRARVTDYERWEEIARGMSDEEEGEEEEGEDDEAGIGDGQESARAAGASHGAPSLPRAPQALSAQGAQPATAAESQPATATKSAATHGGQTERYVWSQTKSELTVNFFVPPRTRAKDVRTVHVSRDHVELELEAPDFEKSEAPKFANLEVPSFQKFDGELSHAVVADEDPAEVDWELCDPDPPPAGEGGARVPAAACRWLRLTLRKDSPPGVVIWWDRVFKGDAAVDVSRFEGRDKARASQMEANWKEAHELFRQKVRDRQKVQIEL